MTKSSSSTLNSEVLELCKLSSDDLEPSQLEADSPDETEREEGGGISDSIGITSSCICPKNIVF